MLNLAPKHRFHHEIEVGIQDYAEISFPGNIRIVKMQHGNKLHGRLCRNDSYKTVWLSFINPDSDAKPLDFYAETVIIGLNLRFYLVRGQLGEIPHIAKRHVKFLRTS